MAKTLAFFGVVCYTILANGSRLFFYAWKLAVSQAAGNSEFETKQSEVEVVRTRITLECTECKQRNYNMMKDKKTHPERMETKKYCKFCRSHTLHKETK